MANGTGTYAEYQGTIAKDDIRRIFMMIAIAIAIAIANIWIAATDTAGGRIPICLLLLLLLI
jgi:hypothetical protein